MIDGAFRLPLGMRGKTELSATRNPSTPMTRPSWVHHRHRVVPAPHPRCAAGMVGAFHMVADERIQCSIIPDSATRLNFMLQIRRKGRLSHDLARQANTAAEIFPILRVAHVIETNARRVLSALRAGQLDPTATGRAHGADMGLKPVPLGHGLPVIAHSILAENDTECQDTPPPHASG